MENQEKLVIGKICDGCLFSVRLEREALELACQDLLDIVKYTNKTKKDLVKFYIKKAQDLRENKSRFKLTVRSKGKSNHIVADKYDLEELTELYDSKETVEFVTIDGSVIVGELIGFEQDRSIN